MPAIENTSDNPVLARLRELVIETDSEFVAELIDIYINTTPTQIQTLAKALDTQDHRMLTIAAHTLKGNSLNLGATQLGAVSFKFEELGRSNAPISAANSIKEIANEFEKVKEILLSFKQNKY